MSAQRIRFLVIALAACLASCHAAGAAEGSFQRTLQVNGPVNLEISTGSGSIQVRAGARNEVAVIGHIKATMSWFATSDEERVKKLEANPPIQQSGNDIRIGHIDDPELRRNIAISYDVTVPAETELRAHSGSGNQLVEGIRGPLDVDAGSGGIRVSEIGDRVHAGTGSGSIVLERVKGNVRAKAGSGTIRALGIAGSFEGDTGSGEITLEQTAPGAVRADTGSGGIDLRGIKGSLDAKAGSGTIHVEGTPTGPWIVHAGSGSVRLRLASEVAFDLNAHTSSGSITVAQPVTVQGAIGRKEIHGKVRGGGLPVEIQTGSGNIDIN
jgi:DUF4097 and DUF4098 domain-containing protein YvlB